MWAGPLPMRWVAQIGDVSEERFHRQAGARTDLLTGSTDTASCRHQPI